MTTIFGRKTNNNDDVDRRDHYNNYKPEYCKKRQQEVDDRMISSTQGDPGREPTSVDCDANNNGAGEYRQMGVKNLSDDLHQQSACEETLSSSSNDLKDWHLLEVDDQLLNREPIGVSKLAKLKQHSEKTDRIMSSNKLESLLSQSGMMINNIENNNNCETTKSDENEYIEIDPLKLKSKFSPTLIYLCTAIYSLMPLASLISSLLLVALLFSKFYFITILYLGWIFLDRKTCNKGGRRMEAVYNSKFWSYLAAYFPIKLRHTRKFQLDPNENYILNYHPHGISAFGAVTAFATNGLNFSKLFPGITARFMVHETSFVMPVMKETFAFRGDCSVNSKSIDYMLSSSKGNLLTIVVGGLAEADLSDSKVLKIVVAERKGFVKKALIHGANIVPCIAFGENSVFTKVNLKPSSLMHRLETKWYKLFKFKHPIYYGRSLVSENLKGVMPYKRPITVVMGNPIKVQRKENPTQQEIDELHKSYLNQLRSMYAANQDLCAKYDKVLELI